MKMTLGELPKFALDYQKSLVNIALQTHPAQLEASIKILSQHWTHSWNAYDI